MARRRRPRPRRDFEPNAEVVALLRQDVPASVKVALRLCVKGGRQRKRRCKVCGTRGTKLQVHTDAEAWKVEASASAPVQRYWLCQRHYDEEQRSASNDGKQG